jgi:type I restriction enzyme R subunit
MLDSASAIFRNDLAEEQQADFRAKVKTYVRLYVFLSQIVPFENPYLEKLYIFLNSLQNKLGSDTAIDLAQGILDNIDIDSYRLQLEATTNIAMEQGEDLKPIPTEMRGGTTDAKIDRLSNILQTFNDRYKGNFTDFDKVRPMLESLANNISQNKQISDAYEHTPSTARITLENILGNEIINYSNGNLELMKLYFDDNKEFKEDLSAMMFGMVKEIFNKKLSKER